MNIKENDILRMQDFLKENPIDHKFDDEVDYFDGDCPLEQVMSRFFFDKLKELNRLPDDVPWIQEELKRESNL